MGDLGVAIHGAEAEVVSSGLDIPSYLAACDEAAEAAQAVRGDSVWAASAFQGLPWMEAICGCGVFRSGASLWAGAPEGEIEEHLARWESSPWLMLLRETTSALSSHAGTRYPVGLPVLRGPADVAAAMLSPAIFYMDMYDHPDRLQGLLERISAICLEVYRQTMALLPASERGFAQASRQVWAPERCIETQEDAAANISPSHYRKFIHPLDKQLWKIAPYVFRHFHSAALQHLAVALAEAQLRAVEITVDDGGPPLSLVKDRIADVQKAGKPVIVHGTLGAEDMAYLVGHLEPAGLYIAARAWSATSANSLLAKLESLIDEK
jgi:hypothetical protein